MELWIVHLSARLYDDYRAVARVHRRRANMPPCHGKPPNAHLVTRTLNGLCRQRFRRSAAGDGSAGAWLEQPLFWSRNVPIFRRHSASEDALGALHSRSNVPIGIPCNTHTRNRGEERPHQDDEYILKMKVDPASSITTARCGWLAGARDNCKRSIKRG